MSNDLRKVIESLQPFGFLSWSQIFDLATDNKTPLVRAKQGIRWCGDERPLKGAVPIQGLPPAIFGGAFGFWLKFRMLGNSSVESWQSTKKLYWMMNWGQMQIHNDDHGDEAGGCGFLWNMSGVSSILSVLYPQLYLLPIVVNPTNEFSIAKQIADVYTLGGTHKIPEARFLINLRHGSTVNPNQVYKTQPTFVSDLWVMDNEQVRSTFNALARTNFSHNQFLTLHLMQELAIGRILGALADDFSNLTVAF